MSQASGTQPAGSAAGDESLPRRGRGLLIAGFATLAAGLIIALVGGIGGTRTAVAVVDLLGASAVSAPTEVLLDLEPGTYSVYQKADGTAVALDPQTITVTGPTGGVPVGDGGPTETISRGQTVFEAVVRFTVQDSGQYTVSLQGVDPTEVVIGPSLAALLARAVPWIALLGVGVLVAIVGLGLLVAGIVQRRRPVPAATAPAPVAVQVPSGPAAGWYPDPAGFPGQRYWDGAAWTEHTAP